MNQDLVCAIVLAAGKGTRMKSELVKVLHPVLFAPMIFHVLDALQGLKIERTVVVVGHQKERMMEALQFHDVILAIQREQLGTGHAVLTAESVLTDFHGTALIVCGDIPLIRSETLARMLAQHQQKRPALTIMTTTLDDPTHYGRIILDGEGGVLRIVEERDTTADERRIKIINAGIYCADVDFLFQALKQVGSNNSQREVYLTDVVEKAIAAKAKVDRYECLEAIEVLGVNSRVELAVANKILQGRRNIRLMESGVTLAAPDSSYVAPSVEVGEDTVIAPNVYITGTTVIGKGCSIGPFVVINDAEIGNRAKIGSFSVLDGCCIAEGENIASHTVR